VARWRRERWLRSNKQVTNPGYHTLGINMLYQNTTADVHHHSRAYGFTVCTASSSQLATIQAEPGTLYEWHKNDQGALYVK
jgi:hypothetical protein